jgi:hypothetical protein
VVDRTPPAAKVVPEIVTGGAMMEGGADVREDNVNVHVVPLGTMQELRATVAVTNEPVTSSIPLKLRGTGPAVPHAPEYIGVPPDGTLIFACQVANPQTCEDESTIAPVSVAVF